MEPNLRVQDLGTMGDNFGKKHNVASEDTLQPEGNDVQ